MRDRFKFEVDTALSYGEFCIDYPQLVAQRLVGLSHFAPMKGKDKKKWIKIKAWNQIQFKDVRHLLTLNIINKSSESWIFSKPNFIWDFRKQRLNSPTLYVIQSWSIISIHKWIEWISLLMIWYCSNRSRYNGDSWSIISIGTSYQKQSHESLCSEWIMVPINYEEEIKILHPYPFIHTYKNTTFLFHFYQSIIFRNPYGYNMV